MLPGWHRRAARRCAGGAVPAGCARGGWPLRPGSDFTRSVAGGGEARRREVTFRDTPGLPGQVHVLCYSSEAAKAVRFNFKKMKLVWILTSLVRGEGKHNRSI